MATMNRSATWDALQLVRDARQDGRTDDADRVLAALSDEGAWDFEIREYSRTAIRQMITAAQSERAAYLCDPAMPYECPSPMDDLVTAQIAVRAAYRFADKHGAPEIVMHRLARWLGEASQMLNPTSDAIEVRIRSWASYSQHVWNGVFAV